VIVRRLALLSVCSIAMLVPLGPSSADPPVSLPSVTGKVLWVDFWASWCAPCRRSFPWMNTMHEKYGAQGLQIIAVNVDKERTLAEEFLEETPADFELRFDPNGALAQQFGVQAMPSSFLLDSSGNVIARHFGFKTADRDQYEADIAAALAAAADPQRFTGGSQ
jgi:thiol-disulfide isomerase/thioredoxin